MSEMPREIIVNPQEKAVIVTPSLAEAFPGAPEAFQKVDDAFLENPEAYLEMLEASTFSLRAKYGFSVPKVDCSLIPGTKAGSELLVVYAPFSDCSPNSSAQDIYRYMQADEQDPSSKSKAAPNSWNQISKSGVMSELLQAIDSGMPVLTIFSPVPTQAYSSTEQAKFRRGDFTPAARVTAEAVRIAQERLHGLKSETQIDELHLHGASLGASNAIGAGRGLLGTYDIRSITAQELIMGPKNYFPDLAAKFTVKKTVGEPSHEVVTQLSPDYARIAEPAIRQMIDRDGSEIVATNARTISAMLKKTYLDGLTHPEQNQTPRDIEYLAEEGVPLVVALAANSGITQDTRVYLPNLSEEVVVVSAEHGHRVDHMVDEHVALTALVAAMNIARTRKSTQPSV